MRVVAEMVMCIEEMGVQWTADAIRERRHKCWRNRTLMYTVFRVFNGRSRKPSSPGFLRWRCRGARHCRVCEAETIPICRTLLEKTEHPEGQVASAAPFEKDQTVMRCQLAYSHPSTTYEA